MDEFNIDFSMCGAESGADFNYINQELNDLSLDDDLELDLSDMGF